LDGAFGDALAILVREFFEQLIILRQQRPARAGRKGVLIVGNEIAAGGRQGLRFMGHKKIWFGRLKRFSGGVMKNHYPTFSTIGDVHENTTRPLCYGLDEMNFNMVPDCEQAGVRQVCGVPAAIRAATV
jgi:hypothetical protein